MEVYINLQGGLHKLKYEIKNKVSGTIGRKGIMGGGGG